MIPVKFEESDRTLAAGDNPNTGDLHTATAIDPNLPEGYGVIVSCWEPSAEELAEFLKTKKIYIGVMCALNNPTQPPIYALGVNPFTALGWKPVKFNKHTPAQRKFWGEPNFQDLEFKIDERSFSMTINTDYQLGNFILLNVVEFLDGGEEIHDHTSRPYFKAWEILSAKYKEV